MVKCPTGTPSQVRANYAHFNRVSASIVEVAESLAGESEKEPLVQESELEYDSNIADKRHPPTAKDEMVNFFISCFLDVLLKRWEAKPCMKAKFKTPRDQEEYGEDLGPCEVSATSSMLPGTPFGPHQGDSLSDFYQKRSANLSKEKQNTYTESTESEYLNEDFDSIESQDGTKKAAPDEDVHFEFSNGVWYKGRVSRRMMEGNGHFFWSDGTAYQGEFESGCVTGKGRMEFPDLSVYEGDVFKAFRHGEGMFCFSDSPVMYSGQWWLGKKHGYGLIVYNGPTEDQNYYKGEWQDGEKEGFGFRQYPSGARYVGYWSKGKRHGKGVMFWSNNDIYRGEWKEGRMHGYGEYIWNGFVNKSLSYPAANVYRGQWAEGKRNGIGLLEVKSGCFIETVWVNNVKEGYGAVICRNGAVVSSELLFVRDKPAVFPITFDSWVPCDTLIDGTPKKKLQNEEVIADYSSRTRIVKAISIPINAAVHTLNLTPHTRKFMKQRRDAHVRSNLESEMKKQFISVTPPKEGRRQRKEGDDNEEEDEEEDDPELLLTEAQQVQLAESILMEESNLRNFIIFNISALKLGYEYYSKLACEVLPPFKCILLRLFLWQMLMDGGVPNSSLSLVDIDDLLANEEFLLIHDAHSPFEQIQLWQFIQILIVLSWHLYGRFVYGELPPVENKRVTDFLARFNSCEMNNVLKTALQYFIENDVFWDKFLEGAEPPWESRKFEENNIAPMEAMYHIYCSVGKPHSARDFVNTVCRPEPEGHPPLVRYFEKLPFCKVEGRNAITIAGELQHIPECDPFNFPELFQLERNTKKAKPKLELTRFARLGAKRVTQCLIEVCPGIVNEDCIVNMNYQLTFLEFYKVIILCTKLHLKMKIMDQIRGGLIADYKLKMEEYKKQMSEYEKSRDNSVVSRKKSRQAGDLAKRGRK